MKVTVYPTTQLNSPQFLEHHKPRGILLKSKLYFNTRYQTFSTVVERATSTTLASLLCVDSTLQTITRAACRGFCRDIHKQQTIALSRRCRFCLCYTRKHSRLLPLLYNPKRSISKRSDATRLPSRASAPLSIAPRCLACYQRWRTGVKKNEAVVGWRKPRAGRREIYSVVSQGFSVSILGR